MLVLPAYNSHSYLVIKDNHYYCVSAHLFAQEALTNNGVLGGNKFAVASATEASAGHEAYKAFDDSNSSYYCSSLSELGADGTWETSQWLTFYNPAPLKVRTITVYNEDDIKGCIKNYQVLGSNDDTDYTLLTEGEAPPPDLAKHYIYVGKNDSYVSSARAQARARARARVRASTEPQPISIKLGNNPQVNYAEKIYTSLPVNNTGWVKVIKYAIKVNDTQGWKYYRIACQSSYHSVNNWSVSKCELDTWGGIEEESPHVSVASA